MEFFLNPTALMPFFAVPVLLADKHLKLASEKTIKIMLYILRHSDEQINIQKLADFFRMNENDVRDALDYWVNAGIIGVNSSQKKELEPEKAPPVKTVRSKAVKPTREEVALRGAQDEKIQFLLREAQLKFGRTLKSGEASTLVWLYDDAGVDVSLILMAAEYSASATGTLNIRTIEKIALDWADNGVKTIAQAENRIAVLSRQETCWRLLESVFGLEHRSPSTKELELATLFVEEWKFSREMLRAAYEQCVDSTSKFSLPYIKKILESWHKKGYTSVEHTKAEDKKPKNDSSSHATYDIEAFMRKLNSEE